MPGQLLLIACCSHSEIPGSQDLSRQEFPSRIDILVNEGNEVGWHIVRAVVVASFDRALTVPEALVNTVELNAGYSYALPAGHRANRIGLRMD